MGEPVYLYVLGNPRLFDNAPAQAFVVLEDTFNGKIYYASSFAKGAHYWNALGDPGRPTGLSQTQVDDCMLVARRTLAEGSPPPPKLPKNRNQRLKAFATLGSKAAQGLKNIEDKQKVITPCAPDEVSKQNVLTSLSPQLPESVPLPVASASELPGDHTSLRNLVVTSGMRISNVEEDNEPWFKGPIPDAPLPSPEPPLGMNFISAMGQEPAKELFMTISRNGNVKLTKGLVELFGVGTRVDVQVCLRSGNLRVGRVQSGGRVLNRTGTFSIRWLSQHTGFKGRTSLRIHLTEENGWYYGRFPAQQAVN